MTLQQQITADLTSAMKNREALKLETLRSIKTAFTNELVEKKRTPQDNLSDEEAIVVIKRLHKQRLDAAQQFDNAGRDDLASKETAEAEIITAYLPAQLSDEKLDEIVANTIKNLGGEVDKSKMGIVIGQVMKQVGNQADGNRVRLSVQKHL